MQWLERLNCAIQYIEEHLSDEISYEQAAKIACCSTFHFQRMFSYIAGVPLSEYIRRRKMTQAAFLLQQSDSKVIDLALQFGYESPTAFNRAFAGIHGISPSQAKKHGVSLRAYPRITFQVSIKGDVEMEYRIVDLDAFTIVGVKRHFPMNVEDNFIKVPQFWQEANASGIVPEILAQMDCEPYGLLGVCTCMNGKDFDYYIAVASKKQVPDKMVSYVVPKGTWAIFPCTGPMPNAIQELQQRILSQWLPNSGYEYADAPDIEVYFEGDLQSPDYKSEVWLPVVKKP